MLNAKLDYILPDEIFRAYDIRGVVDITLTESIVFDVGRAVASLAKNNNETKVVVARDGRLSGPKLIKALKDGINTTGIDVVDIGMVPTPVLYFATKHLNIPTGIMLTGSHNPVNYNGLKIMLSNKALYGEDIQNIKTIIQNQSFVLGNGQSSDQNIVTDYINYIKERVSFNRKLKIVIDCGNGVPGAVAPNLYKSLGVEVISLFTEVDGNFPNHHPDPGDPKNLKDLINKVKEVNADIGFGFDGDGDRLGIVDNNGKVIWPDRVLMLLAKDLLLNNQGGKIIYDVKCTSDLENIIKSYGGEPILWQTGHSLIKAKMKETNALLAAEMSGHIFYQDGWFGFDDALYAGVRLLEILSKETRVSSEIFQEFPENISTPETPINVTESTKFSIVERLTKNIKEKTKFKKDLGFNLKLNKLITLDGVRIEFDCGWGLVRPSNTTPKLITRFEANSQENLDKIKEFFKAELLIISADLEINFDV